jgi:excinuclease UvrABC nuclease subunit
MGPQDSNKFPYDLKTIIRNAPPRPGVYSVFSQAECVYVGNSDDVCAGLLEVYFEDNPRLNDKDITHFSFEVIVPDSLASRRGPMPR